MSLLPHLNPRKPADDSEPASEPQADSRGPDDPIFDMVPPPPVEAAAPLPAIAAAEENEKPYKPSAVAGRNVHSIGITDLSRLSIDNDGRLYWDGKPVEVRRRILMSRAQIIGATIVGAFIVIGAIGAAVHGSSAALDFACRIGWNASYCGQPDPAPPPRPDIPA